MSSSTLTKLAEGREAEIFAWHDGAVLRLLRNPDGRPQLEWEAAAMRAAAAAGVPVPAVHELATVDGRPGLVMERIDGGDLLTDLGRRPWRISPIARITAETQARLHETSAPDAVPDLRENLRRRIETSLLVPEALRPAALNALDALPGGDRLCHNDFHPGNIMLAGDRPVVIDWTNVRRGDPAADVQRTLLMLRLGEPPPGSSALLRALTRVGRRLFAAAYLRAYRRARPIDLRLVDRWELPVAANRLSEGIAEERSRVLALIERNLARSNH